MEDKATMRNMCLSIMSWRNCRDLLTDGEMF